MMKVLSVALLASVVLAQDASLPKVELPSGIYQAAVSRFVIRSSSCGILT